MIWQKRRTRPQGSCDEVIRGDSKCRGRKLRHLFVGAGGCERKAGWLIVLRNELITDAMNCANEYGALWIVFELLAQLGDAIVDCAIA